DGKKIEQIFKDFNGEVTEKVIYSYDERGCNTIRDIYDTEDKLLMKTIISYNNQKKILEEKRYKSEGYLSNITTYNSQQRVDKSVTYTINGDIWLKEKYKYDDKGNVIELENLGGAIGGISKLI